MKKLKGFKKFGAALTAIAMLGTLSTGVFAAEVEEIIDVPVIESVEIDVPIISVDVEDIEEVEEVDLGELLADDFDIMSTGDGDVTTNLIGPTDSDITITAVTATKKAVDDVTLYNVKLEYTMPAQTEVPQVTLLGYIFTDTDAFPGEILDSSIRAVDQRIHDESGDGIAECKGEIDFVLSSAQAGVSDDATLVLMVGTDADLDNKDAQAIAINLSSALEAPTTWEAIGAIVSTSEITAPSDADEDAIMALLAGITATVTDGSNTATAAVENWTTTGTIEPGAELTYTGTVVADDSVWTSGETLTVTVTVTIAEDQGGDDEPTTWEATGATVAPDTLNVAADATDATIKTQLADAVVTVTGADSKSSTNVSVAWATTDAIAAGTTVTYTGTVTPGTDAPWTGTQTVEVTVTIAAAQGGEPGGDDDEVTLLGDANGDGAVNGRDAQAVQRFVKYSQALANEKNGDVNKDGSTNGRDAQAIQRYVKYSTPF